MPNYGQYGTNSTWKGRFDQRQIEQLRRGFDKSDAWCSVTVTYPTLVVEDDVQAHIFNKSIKTTGSKQIACHPDKPLPQGTVIDYVDGFKYLCTDMDSHQAIQKFGVINKAETVFKWIDGNGDLQVQYGVDNRSMGVQDTARRVSEIDSKRKLFLQLNDATSKIKEDMRFIFGGISAFKVTDIDNWSKEGLLQLVIESTQILPDKDDLVNNIAYNGEQNFEPQPSNDIQFSSNRLDVIEGYSNSVSVSEVGVPTTTFTFSIIDLPTTSYTILSSDGNSITIQCNEYYHEGILRATSDSDPLKYAEIPIILSGLY
jgi:hypothetical protein